MDSQQQAINTGVSDLQAEESQVQDRQKQQSELEASNLAARSSGLGPMEKDLQYSVAQPIPQRPAPQAMPEAPKQPIVDAKDYQSFAMALLGMALIGGKASHGNWLGVGSAANGAMEGYLKGDQEKAQENWSKYQEEFKAAQEKETEANKRFEDILSDRNLTINEKIQQYKLAAVEYDRADQKAAAEQKSIDRMWEQHNAHVAALDKTKIGAANINVRVEAAQAAHAEKSGGAGGTPYDKMDDNQKKAVDFYAQMALRGDQSWRQGLGRTKNGSELIRAVDMRMPELAEKNGQGAGDVVTNKSTKAALDTTLKDRTKYLANADQFSRTLESQIGIVEKYIPKGVAGQSPVLNKWIQNGRTAIAGNADVTALDNALTGLAREHQRFVTGLTSNAQLQASAAETGDRLLNKAQNAKQMHAAIQEIREEKEAAIKSGREEVGSLQDQIRNLGASSKPQQGSDPAIEAILKKHNAL